jgi:hypothetical protein
MPAGCGSVSAGSAEVAEEDAVDEGRKRRWRAEGPSRLLASRGCGGRGLFLEGVVEEGDLLDEAEGGDGGEEVGRVDAGRRRRLGEAWGGLEEGGHLVDLEGLQCPGLGEEADGEAVHGLGHAGGLDGS